MAERGERKKEPTPRVEHLSVSFFGSLSAAAAAVHARGDSIIFWTKYLMKLRIIKSDPGGRASVAQKRRCSSPISYLQKNFEQERGRKKGIKGEERKEERN